jgi:hypothetical protein
MSLHLDQQCQRATQQKRRTTKAPRLLYRGTAVRLCWRPIVRSRQIGGCAPSVRGHIWRAGPPVNDFLQFSFSPLPGPENQPFSLIYQGNMGPLYSNSRAAGDDFRRFSAVRRAGPASRRAEGRPPGATRWLSQCSPLSATAHKNDRDRPYRACARSGLC